MYILWKYGLFLFKYLYHKIKKRMNGFIEKVYHLEAINRNSLKIIFKTIIPVHQRKYLLGCRFLSKICVSGAM